MKGNRITKTTTNNRSSAIQALLLTLILLATGCRINDTYNAHTNISNDGWTMRDTQTFTFDIDCQSNYDVNIFLRHDNQYKYRNIWLFVDHISPDSTITTDTINIALADQYGRWLGSGWGSTNQIQQALPYTQPLDSGTHHIKVTQAMRDPLLKGIKNIGINITPAK